MGTYCSWFFETCPKIRELCAQEVVDCDFGIGQSATLIRNTLISFTSKGYVCDLSAKV